MRQLSIAILFSLLTTASCHTPQKTVGKSTSTDTQTEATVGSKFSPVGQWKIVSVKNLTTTTPVADDIKKAMINMITSSGKLEFAADGSFHVYSADGNESGTWKLDTATNTIISEKASGKETTKIISFKPNYFKCLTKNADFEAELELKYIGKSAE